MNALIAVTSQNRKTVTGHTGKCRKFWLYPIENGMTGERRLVELGMDETFHATPGGLPAALTGITALITQGMGQGMIMRLQRIGVQGWITAENDPDVAVQAFLRGEASAAPEEQGQAHAHEDEDEEDGEDCGCGH
ncbi:MAG: NifB/NifX family molybdenum-iron cluster-binding protein [Pseudomonadota bacterium]